MIVICEECGKKYRIDPSVIKGKQARFKCKSCDNIITVEKPEPAPPEPPPSPHVPEDLISEIPEEPLRASTPAAAAPPLLSREAKRLGLRIKMIILFFLIPIALIIGASALFILKLQAFSSSLTKEAVQTTTEMTEDIVTKRAQAVASTVKSFLLTHPELKKTLFNYDLTFRRIALQKIGLTGSTALYEKPGPDGVWRAWSHRNPDVIGRDIRDLKKYLGKGYSMFFKILSSIGGKKQSKGYYMAPDVNSVVRLNFMVCMPVEGTPYVVAATCYPDEFTAPAQLMEVRAKKLAIETRNIIGGILAVTLILIGLVVFLYGQRLAGRIKNLTAAAERISVGELDVEIEKKMPNDEIGDLANAFGRMQTSIRISIERLRRKR